MAALADDGTGGPASTAAEYDQLVSDLVCSSVIADEGMVYFDVRPAVAAPTLELRVCDSCPSVDTIVLIAGLFRALVEREIEGLRAGTPAVEVSAPMGRAALWRAARSGLEGELVDVAGPCGRPAAEAVIELVRLLRPQLEAAGDWDCDQRSGRPGADRRHVGGPAAPRTAPAGAPDRCRRPVDRRDGGQAGPTPQPPWSKTRPCSSATTPTASTTQATRSAAPSYDEAVDTDGRPRPRYERLLRTVAELGVALLRSREGDVEQDQRAEKITFRVSGQAGPRCSRSTRSRGSSRPMSGKN